MRKNARLPWALGWASLGIGLTEMVFAEGLCRVLGLPKRRAGLMRAFGVRELTSGWGLLGQPHRREWVWSRVVGDALDLTFLASTLGRPRASRAWQGFITAAVAGLTLVDVYAAMKRDAALPERHDLVPTESWRGSGLAEDVGVHAAPAEEVMSEEVRQRMMDAAARELGLPEDPEPPGPRHRA
ncbi:MAG: hypothetical protein ABW123_21400 [Cystobacter sp.]